MIKRASGRAGERARGREPNKRANTKFLRMRIFKSIEFTRRQTSIHIRSVCVFFSLFTRLLTHSFTRRVTLRHKFVLVHGILRVLLRWNTEKKPIQIFIRPLTKSKIGLLDCLFPRFFLVSNFRKSVFFGNKLTQNTTFLWSFKLISVHSVIDVNLFWNFHFDTKINGKKMEFVVKKF